MAETIDNFIFGLAFGAPDVRNLRKAEKMAADTEKKREKQVKEAGRRIERLRTRIRNTQDRDEKKQLQRQLTNLRTYEKRAKSAYRQVAKEAREAGKAAERAAERRSRATREIRGGLVRGAGGLAAGIVGAGVAAGAGLVSMTKQVAENGAELQRWAKTMDVSVEALSTLQEGFGLVAVPADNTREAIKTLRENLGELARVGTGPAKDSLGSLGLALEDIDGLDADEQMAVLADAMRDVQDPAKQLSIAIELMGEDGRHLLPVLRDGGDAVRALGMRAKETGAVMDQTLVESTVELDKNMAVLRGQLKGSANDISAEVIPAFNEWYQENQELIDQDIAGVTRNISDAIQSLLPFLDTLTSGFRLASEAASGLALVGESLSIQFQEWSQGNFISDSEAFDRASERRIRRNQEASAARAERQAAQSAAAPVLADIRASQAAFGRAGRRSQAGAFEAAELSRGRGGRRGRADAMGPEDLEADEMFGEELRRLAANSGVGDVAVNSALKAAGRELKGGAAQQVARQAALRELGGKAGVDFTKTNGDPLMSELFGSNVPDIELSKIARGAQPQTLVSNINNNFQFDIDQSIQSGADAGEVARQSAKMIRQGFESSIEKSTKTAKVTFLR